MDVPSFRKGLPFFLWQILCVKAYSALSGSRLELIKDVEKLSRDLQNLHSAKPLFIISSTTSPWSTGWEEGQGWIWEQHRRDVVI